MASAELTKLYQLHLIDVGILEIKKKAAALAASKQFETQLASLSSELAAKEAEFHKLHAEQKDIELSNKQLEDKIKQIDQRMFGGSVSNQKEADAMNSQKASFQSQIEASEDKLLGLFDTVPAAEKAYKSAQAEVVAKTKEFEEWKAKAVVYKKQLEAKYAELNSKRPAALVGISSGVLARYDAIKQQHHGIGLSLVTKQSTCQECGNHVAEKSIESINDDRIVTCEDCHRILYWTGGLI